MYRNYMLKTPAADKLRVMRPVAEMIDAHYAALIGDADLIERLDAIAAKRRDARLEMRRNRRKVYKSTLRAKRAAIRNAAHAA